MSIRYSLLAILDAGPRHGYALKSEFEAATGNVWPLNVGQVYSTLSRLQRDGLVLVAEDDDGQKMYRISDAGRHELRRWFGTPVVREVVPRQELAIKLVFAMRSGPEQVREVVQRQLVATMASLQEFTMLKATAEGDGDLAWLMMLDALIFQAEAEARWLELCEARLDRVRPQSLPAPEVADAARDVERTS
jgi:DNA-binding PadR family transcriptional regulator